MNLLNLDNTKNYIKTKKHTLGFLFIIFCSFFVNAQKMEIITRFPIMENDSVTGYCFINKELKASKGNDKYVITIYNRNMNQSEDFSFLMNNDYVLVQSKSSFNIKDHHIMFNFIITNGNTGNQNQRIVIYDFKKKEVITDKIVDYDADSIRNSYWYLLENNRIIKVTEGKNDIYVTIEKSTIEIFDYSLSSLEKIDIYDSQNEMTKITNVFFINKNYIALNVMGYNKKSREQISFDNDIWIISLINNNVASKISINEASKLPIRTISNIVDVNKNNEFILFGEMFYPTAKSMGYFQAGFKKTGIFSMKINLDLTSPVISSKDFDYEGELIKYGDYLNSLSLSKIVFDDNKLMILYIINDSDINYFNSINFNNRVKKGYTVYSKNDNNELNSKDIINNTIYIMEIDSNLNIINFNSLGGNKTIDKTHLASEFTEKKTIHIEHSAYYNSLSNYFTVISEIPEKRKIVAKSKLIYLEYEEEKPLKSDEFLISEKATWTEYYPAKRGYITIIEYFEKEQKLVKRIEKLNL